MTDSSARGGFPGDDSGEASEFRSPNSVEINFLTVLRPSTKPATTTQVERRRYRSNKTWEYDAHFETIPDALEVTTDETPAPITIEGKVAGTPFHVTAPRITMFGPCEGDATVDVVFRPTSTGYERFGTLENRDGAWVPLATTEIAEPKAVWRKGTDPECHIDHDMVARSRAAHYWTPVTAEREDWSPRADILNLLSILPKDTPASTVADIAGATMDVDEALVREAVPGLRAKLRSGERCGQEVTQSDGTVWRHTPAWAIAAREGTTSDGDQGNPSTGKRACTASGCTRTDDLSLVGIAGHARSRTLCRHHRKEFLGVTS